jgi:hypothetical protein
MTTPMTDTPPRARAQPGTDVETDSQEVDGSLILAGSTPLRVALCLKRVTSQSTEKRDAGAGDMRV